MTSDGLRLGECVQTWRKQARAGRLPPERAATRRDLGLSFTARTAQWEQWLADQRDKALEAVRRG